MADIETGALTPLLERDWPCCFGWPDIAGDWVVYSTISSVWASPLKVSGHTAHDLDLRRLCAASSRAVET